MYKPASRALGWGGGRRRATMAGELARPRDLMFLPWFLLLMSFVNAWNDEAIPKAEASCSRYCVAENCDTFGIRYGKFCGVGWSGCPGEKPCDDLDACCMVHDDCVGKAGLNNVKCHEKLKRCMKKVRKHGKVGFSKTCPYEVAIPTMTQGMDMAILLGQLGGLRDLEKEL